MTVSRTSLQNSGHGSYKSQPTTIRFANNSGEFDSTLGDRFADWVYERYVPRREEVAQVQALDKRVFIAGSTVAAEQNENWRRASVRGVDAILTDYSAQLVRQFRRDAIDF
jgi:hypothetical protein